jgi:hypothetical protein
MMSNEMEFEKIVPAMRRNGISILQQALQTALSEEK